MITTSHILERALFLKVVLVVRQGDDQHQNLALILAQNSQMCSILGLKLAVRLIRNENSWYKIVVNIH